MSSELSNRARICLTKVTIVFRISHLSDPFLLLTGITSEFRKWWDRVEQINLIIPVN